MKFGPNHGPGPYDFLLLASAAVPDWGRANRSKEIVIAHGCF